MACLNMYNNDQHALHHSTMGPRISFSNDFADPQQPIKHDQIYRESPVSSDFEFSVSGYNMISADELFNKGKLVPLRENLITKTTLRDELLVEDDDYNMDVSPRLSSRGLSSRWRGRLGLKKPHILARKGGEKNSHEVLERIDETGAALSFHNGG